MLHFYIFSSNISTEYFKHAAHSPFFSSKCRLFHNSTFLGSCIIYIYIESVQKLDVKLRCQKVKPKCNDNYDWTWKYSILPIPIKNHRQSRVSMQTKHTHSRPFDISVRKVNPINAELNPICFCWHY